MRTVLVLNRQTFSRATSSKAKVVLVSRQQHRPEGCVIEHRLSTFIRFSLRKVYKEQWSAMQYGTIVVNLLKPTGHVMHHQFNIQQLYALPTLYLCVLYLSEHKQRLVPLRA